MRPLPTILLVDDETEVLGTISEGLKATENFAEIMVAPNGRAAIDILNSTPIDVLVTDLKMPEVNGLELLVYLNNHFPGIPAVVISSYSSPAVQSRTRSSGALRLLKKPIRLDELADVLRELSDPEGQRGVIRGLSLTNFLQLISAELKTCALSVISVDNQSGTYYFENGQLLDAVCGEVSGEEAAIEMLMWPESEFKLIEKPGSIEQRRIETNLMSLLMEAARLSDEKDENQGREQLAEILAPPGKRDVNREEQQAEPEQNKDCPNNEREEKTMNMSKLKESIEVLKDDLGDGLLATDIFSKSDGQTIAGFNHQPAASALFAQITNYLIKSLKDSGFPGLGRYFLIDLVDKKSLVCLPLGDYIWGMLIDTSKTPIGLVLNVAVPKVINVYEEALIG